MKNLEVIKAWVRGQAARNKNMKTDGRSLYSYNLKIAERKELCLEIYDYTAEGGKFASPTTSQHVCMVKREVDYAKVVDVSHVQLPYIPRY